MLKPNGRFVRSYALDLLVELNDQPHINKEKLFADAVCYYRWQFTHTTALESLKLYQREFSFQHGMLMAPRPPMVRVACFITWFVQNRFHEMLPLTTKYPDDELFQRGRFSDPCFVLPTGDPMETYLVQWLYWFLDCQPMPNNGCCDDFRWAEALAEHLSEQRDLIFEEYTSLVVNSGRFFRWCWSSLRDWSSYLALLASFLQSDAASPIDQSDFLLADAGFINWFCAHNLDRAPQGASDEQAK